LARRCSRSISATNSATCLRTSRWSASISAAWAASADLAQRNAASVARAVATQATPAIRRVRVSALDIRNFHLLRLTFELTGPLWCGGVWLRMKSRAKCRHAAMGPVERMVRRHFNAPQHFLYLDPLPQLQGSFLPCFGV